MVSCPVQLARNIGVNEHQNWNPHSTISELTRAAVQVVWRTAFKQVSGLGTQRTSGQIAGQRPVAAAAAIGISEMNDGNQPKAGFQMPASSLQRFSCRTCVQVEGWVQPKS